MHQLIRSIAGTCIIGLLVILTSMETSAQARKPEPLRPRPLTTLDRVLEDCKANRHVTSKDRCKYAAAFFIKVANNPKRCYQLAPGDLEKTKQAGDFLGKEGLNDLIDAIEDRACPVRIALLVNLNTCNEFQGNYIEDTLNEYFRALPNSFKPTDHADRNDLSAPVSNLQAERVKISSGIDSHSCVAQIESYLKETNSLQMLRSKCDKDQTKVFYVISQVFLGKLRGELDCEITVKTKIDSIEAGDADSIYNQLVLYALARDAQEKGRSPFAKEYLSAAYTAATCKIAEIKKYVERQREVYERELKEDPTRKDVKERRVELLDETGQATRLVGVIREAIRKMLEDELHGELPTPLCRQSQ